jgi:hypothetical protein
MTEVILCATVLISICWVICLKMDLQAVKDENEKLRAALKLWNRGKMVEVEVSKVAIPSWGKKPD